MVAGSSRAGHSRVARRCSAEASSSNSEEEAGTSASAPSIFGDCAGTAEPEPVNIECKFCIDSTEVTYRQYGAFIDAAPDIEQLEVD